MFLKVYLLCTNLNNLVPYPSAFPKSYIWLDQEEKNYTGHRKYFLRH